MSTRWLRNAAMTVALVVLAACSSDDYGDVGGDLPLDVSQEGDSVLVALDPPLNPTGAASVEPELVQPYTERSLLYLGNRDEGQWKATPLFVFDFSQAQLVGPGPEFVDYVDSLDLSLAVVDTASFRVLQSREDESKNIARTLDLRELTGVTSLDETLLDQDVSALLGSILSGVQDVAGNTFVLPLQSSIAFQWLLDEANVPLGLVDLTPSAPAVVTEDSTINSNFVALASRELGNLQTLFIDDDADVAQGLAPEESLPRILIRLDAQFVADELGLDPEDVGDPSILVFASQDMTHLQRVKVSPQDLTLSSHRPSRVWADFDLVGSSVPGDATVNEALLTLTVRQETSLGGTALQTQPVGNGRSRFILVPDSPNTEGFEVSLANSDVSDTDDLDFILSSRGSVSLFADEPRLVIDVTDFVQRDINLILEDAGIGILVALTTERDLLNVVDFYGVDAPDSLRPRLDVRFTPPADFWE